METIKKCNLTEKQIKRLIDNLYFITKNYSIEFIEFEKYDFSDIPDFTPATDDVICHIKARGYLPCYFSLDQDPFWIRESIGIPSDEDEYSSSHSFYYEE